MASYERGETYNCWLNLYDRTGAKTNASAAVISIYDPCGTLILDSQNMLNNDTGEYYYNHDLSSTATYGMYRVIGDFTISSHHSIQEEEFFVMPWKLEADIRRKCGIGDAKDISDEDLSHLSWSAYNQGLRDLHIHRYAEKPKGNPETGTLWNGTNTAFQTAHHPIGDISGDGVVSGNAVACTQDIDAWWIDADGGYNDATVAVTNAFNGEITITQTGGAAIPSTALGVYLDYWERPSAYDEFLFREAVAYLGCHYVEIRFENRENISIADLNVNQKIILKHPDRYYREYRRIMKMVNKPKIRCV